MVLNFPFENIYVDALPNYGLSPINVKNKLLTNTLKNSEIRCANEPR